MLLIIETQYLENYGAHDWDGIGDCPEHWKAKGGESYVVPLSTSLDENELEALVERLKGAVEYSSPFAREYMVDWHVEEDTYLTRWEEDQLHFEGRITSRSPRLDPQTLEAI